MIYAAAGIFVLLVVVVVLVARRRRGARGINRDSVPPTTQDITVVFTNLTDSIGMFERLGDVIAAKIISDYRAALAPAIRENGGIINKFMGDGVMAIFGAPVPDHDHAAHAVVAVLAMQHAIDSLNERLISEGKTVIRMRVGVATGLAVVGDVGFRDAAEYGALGDIVNLAMRLQELNKSTGTRNLMSDVTAARLNGDYKLTEVKVPNGSLRGAEPGPHRAFEVVSMKE